MPMQSRTYYRSATAPKSLNRLLCAKSQCVLQHGHAALCIEFGFMFGSMYVAVAGVAESAEGVHVILHLGQASVCAVLASHSLTLDNE